MFAGKAVAVWFAALACCILLCGCFEGDAQGENTNDQESQGMQAMLADAGHVLHVILFDISLSLNDAAFEKELAKLTRYMCDIDQTKENSIVIFTIHGNTARQNASVFSEDIARNPFSTNQGKSRDYVDNRQKDAVLACDSIRSIRRTIADWNATLKESCFIDALQSVKGIFASEDAVNSMKYLVFFGDMIEDCSRINIDLDGDSTDLYDPQACLSSVLQSDTYLRGVQIRIYVHGQPGGNKNLPRWYTDRLLRQFWEYVLASQGANAEQITYIQ